MIDPRSDDFLRSYEWRRLRFEVLMEHGARCQCCGASAATGAVMNVDHVKPRKTHPDLALVKENLQVLCDVCNHGKGNWSTKDWRPSQGYWFNPKSKRITAHLWDGEDTFCHQWSGGSMSRNRGPWGVHKELPQGMRICSTCLANSARPTGNDT